MRAEFIFDREALISIALGKKDADLYLTNGRIVNVLTGEIMNNRGVAVGRGCIAYVGPNTDMVGRDTQVIDCNGAYILPGYVEAHCHTDFFNSPRSFGQYVLSMGTTTILTEVITAEVLGARGIDYVLKTTEDLPIKFFVSLPSSLPPYPEIEGVDYVPLSDMKGYSDHPRALAIGEITSWPRIMALDPVILEKMHFALSHGLLIEGHMTGCKGHEINAMVSAGITSCHESITAKEAKEKLELGLYVMLRHGSVRRDLDQLSRLITENPRMNTSRIILTVDLMNPEDLLEYGYTNYLIKSAVEFGIDPVKAVQMVTINPATYLGLDRVLGSIAPGRTADILIVKRLEEGVPQTVIANGKVVAQSGSLCEGAVSPQSTPAVLLPDYWPEKRFSPEDFHIHAPDNTLVNFPVIKIVNKTITKRMDKDIRITGGQVRAIPKEGIIKVSVLGPGDRITTGLLQGFGGDIGGLGTSIGVFNYFVTLGNSDQDMAIAANRMLDIKGGVVLVKDGKILSEIPLPIGGIQSTEDLKTLVGQIRLMKGQLKGFGCDLDDPFFTIHFLCLAGLPYIRILPKGIIDVVTQKIILS
ncbi:Adenine deaminase [uncultured Desulfobacterium sp.]|uniref:adenine deaminase n=1 Tax=uncultured Desulfobacterium sp. TaxID=201089 RepID=A0A445N0H2_9BACT|nr:Adenine deaminase [uncultured Desulfobacterium sp.]